MWNHLDQPMDLLNKINCNRNQHHILTKEEQTDVLFNITHIMDCKCFTIDKDVTYREISISSIKKKKKKKTVQTFQPFYKLYVKQQRVIKFQLRVHGMYYRTLLAHEANLNVEETKNRILNYLYDDMSCLLGRKVEILNADCVCS